MGMTANEPVNYAVRAAIDAGVIELVYQGKDKGLWDFKRSNANESGNSISTSADS